MPLHAAMCALQSCVHALPYRDHGAAFNMAKPLCLCTDRPIAGAGAVKAVQPHVPTWRGFLWVLGINGRQ